MIINRKRQRVSEKCLQEAKEFRDKTWKKKTFGGTVERDAYQKNFTEAQKSWKIVHKLF